MKRNRAIWTTLTTLCTIIGAVVGYVIALNYSGVETDSNGYLHLPGTLKPGDGNLLVPSSSRPALYIVLTLGFAVIFFRLASWLAAHIVGLIGRFRTLSAIDRVLAIVGTLVGLIVGVLITVPLANLASAQSGWLGVQFFVIVTCAGIGLSMMLSMRGEMLRVFPQLDAEAQAEEPFSSVPKLLDTNIIIDGRIGEICKTGFLEGPLWVPSFVLNEVNYFADSSDPVRKAKGQRGLAALEAARDIMMPNSGNGKSAPVPLLHVMNEIPLSVQSVETVDARLVALAKEIGGAIVTNDFNLKSVAKLQGVRVLNLNELAQALKPPVLPGEEMDLMLAKEGSHPGQAVGFLEDGTMVIVADASHHVGETNRVVIDKVLQSVTGKTIFANLKVKDAPPKDHQKGPGDDLFGNGSSGNGHPKKRR